MRPKNRPPGNGAINIWAGSSCSHVQLGDQRILKLSEKADRWTSDGEAGTDAGRVSVRSVS
jgi:hypothetical protein